VFVVAVIPEVAVRDVILVSGTFDVVKNWEVIRILALSIDDLQSPDFIVISNKLLF
jgi:hypothetical protein